MIFRREKLQVVAMPIFFFQSYRTNRQNKCLTPKLPEKLQLYGLYVYYGVHICNYGMLRVNDFWTIDSYFINITISFYQDL